MLSFFIGCLTSTAVVAILKLRFKRIRMKRIGFRQSILHSIVKNTMPTNAELLSQRETQSKLYNKQGVVKVITTSDNIAYWVDKNIFYYAEVRDGTFDPIDAKPVDTMDISKKEMDKLLFILDSLTNG